MYLLVTLRVAIGWHFLYEGLIKLITPGWSSIGYLMNSSWVFSGMFHAIAGNESMLNFIDFINIWGQILIGLALFLGLFTRFAQGMAILLLSLYYLANPPFISNPGNGFEGQYLIISKDLLEIISLFILMFVPTGRYLGLDGLLAGMFKKPFHRIEATPEEAKSVEGYKPASVESVHRRELLKHLATLPILGGFFLSFAMKQKWSSNEEQNLVDAVSGASIKKFTFTGLDQLTEKPNLGRIKDKEFSRVILGGNLLNGWAHSRDLIYVSQLVRAYHTKDRIFKTMMFAEKCGVNTLLSHPIIAKVINEYWDKKYGKIQFISDCTGLTYDNGPQAMPFQEYKDLVQKAIDHGATACYIQGETADYYLENGLYDEMAEVMDMIRNAGIPVGIGAHRIQTIKKSVELGFETDFWMKTMHHHKYWSAKHPTWNDNMYCFDPDETIAFMESLPQPWIAFKVLAAGAIHPQDAFKYAFNAGADFLCVGMYDFQMVDDVNYAMTAYAETRERNRPWIT